MNCARDLACSIVSRVPTESKIAVQRAAGEASTARIGRCFDRYEGRELLEAVMLSVLPLDEPRRAEWRLWLAYFARAAEAVDLARLQRAHYRAWRADLRRAYVRACGPGAAPSRAGTDRATDAAMVSWRFQTAVTTEIFMARSAGDHG